MVTNKLANDIIVLHTHNNYPAIYVHILFCGRGLQYNNKLMDITYDNDITKNCSFTYSNCLK